MMSEFPTSMCHDHRSAHPTAPEAIRISRPLRDLLAAGDDGLTNTTRHAWEIAAAGNGRWTDADQVRLLGGGRDERVRRIKLRNRDENHLDLTMHFEGDYGAIAIGRRVIVICQTLPETVLVAAIGRPLIDIVDAPFLSDPAIVIQRSIHRDDELHVDLRCRCPSHVIDVRLDAGMTGANR